jgi:hypothetical protein
MTPSNTHPGTSVRALRRAFLLQAVSGLLTALLAAPAPIFAQDVIHFIHGPSPYPLYKVNDDGTNLQQLTSFPQVGTYHVYASAQSSYPGGRQFLYPLQVVYGGPYNLMVWSEVSGQSKPLTNINGPLYVNFASARWSNDGLDSFVSFTLWNSVTNEYSTYRAHVSATDIASPTFQPITLGDSRLELVKYWGVGVLGYWYWWNHDGSGFYYVDSSNGTNIWFKAVGGGDTLAYTAPAGLGEIMVSPVTDNHIVAGSGNSILAVDLSTLTSWWIATGSGTGLSSIRGPAFSPDGSLVAFGAVRTAKGTYYPGVYKVPFAGGSVTKVTELQGMKGGGGYIDGVNWTTP